MLAVLAIVLLVASVAFLNTKSGYASQLTSITFVPQTTNPTCAPGLIFYSSSTNQFMGCNSTGAPVSFFATGGSSGSYLSTAYISQGAFGSGTSGSNNQYIFEPTNNSTAMFQIQNSSGTVVFDVDTSNQRVGVGTASPGQKLSVAGTIQSTTGGFMFPDGTTQVSAATVLTPHVQTFTSNGTWTYPSGVNMVWLTICGGGAGGGGGANNGNSASGAGGGGAGTCYTSWPVQVSASVSVTIGAGGSGGAGGNSGSSWNGTSGGGGGVSSFGSLTAGGGGGGAGGLVNAAGGAGGNYGSGGAGGPIDGSGIIGSWGSGGGGGGAGGYNSSNSGGTGGAGGVGSGGSGGQGGAGASGSISNGGGGGGGGGSAYGSGGTGGAGGAATCGSGGSSGSGYGSGGGGGGGGGSSDCGAGGAGKPGFAIVVWWQ